MPFLKSIVLLDVMEIVPSDDNCSLHFHTSDHPCQYSSSDADISSERTLLVYVVALIGL